MAERFTNQGLGQTIGLLFGCSGDTGRFRPPSDIGDAGGSSFARLRITISVPRDGDPQLTSDARLLR